MTINNKTLITELKENGKLNILQRVKRFPYAYVMNTGYSNFVLDFILVFCFACNFYHVLFMTIYIQ